MTAARAPARTRRPARARPRVILLWALVAVAVAVGLYAAAPWILPVRVYEGPLVQMASEDGVTLVWYTTRSAACTVSLTVGDQERTAAAVADGRRNRVCITGLTPGARYGYEIRTGSRRLTDGLAFQTNRAAGERFTFIVFGDSGVGSRAQYLLAGEMTRAEPPADFLLHTGDLVYPDGARRRYEERFFAPYRHLLARVNFWPCLGNHDLDRKGSAAPTSQPADGAAYQEVFELPQNGPPGLPKNYNYWFDYAASRFAVIDSNASEETLRDRVAPWLREVMAAASSGWKFVVFHHPPYTGGKHKPNERVQRTLVPVIEATGVDLVFNGHDHTYQRTHPLRDGRAVASDAGPIYIITAAAGARLYEASESRPDYVAVLDNQNLSFTQVTIDDELTLRQIALDGQVIDEFTLRKSASDRPEQEPASVPASLPAP